MFNDSLAVAGRVLRGSGCFDGIGSVVFFKLWDGARNPYKIVL